MTFFKKATAAPETETGAEAPEAHNFDGDKLAQRAHDFGAKVGDASEEAIGVVMKAKEDWQGGPFRVLLGLQNDFSEEELNEFAVPDEEEGNNPDIFKVSRQVKGKTKLVDSNFYVNFADGTPSGEHILEQIEFVERAGNPNMVKDDIPQEILDLTPHERETKINFLKGRRNTIRQSYKKAMALYFQFKEVNAYPGIQAEPIWVKDKEGEEVENTTKPIAVWLIPDEGKPIAKWEALSIGAFMKLRPRRAKENGGTFQNLIESGATKKAPGKGATTEDNKGFHIETVERGIDFIAELHRWMEEISSAKDKVDIGKVYKQMNTKDNDELVVAVVELRNMLQDLAKDTGADAKYVRLQQAGSDLVQEVADKTAA